MKARGNFPENFLLVEDNLIIMLDIEETLRAAGVSKIHRATSSAQAEKMLADVKVDCAILDYGLGKGNSTGIAERLAASGIPCIFISGYGADIDLPGHLRHLPVVGKPFSREDLLAGIEMALQANRQK